MNIFRRPSFADSTGDAIPFYHNGKYHIFSLTPPKGTTVYPARLRTTWEHTVSEDLVNWKSLPTALFPSDDENAPDASGIWTGSVIYGEGKYHAFYTGYSLKVKYQQTICHATSDDSITWTKDASNPVIIPKTELYEPLDWRDPYVFYNEDDACYWILISARKKQGAPNRRGCIVLYRSKDLAAWDYYGELYAPGHTNCPECAEMYKIGENWYLSYSRFSEFVNTIYRVSKSPFGPWRTPKRDGIGGRRFYAAKSLENDEGRRFYFAWAHDRAENTDYGEWYWGGAFCVPHEVIATKDGELDVKLPMEIENTISEPVKWDYQPVLGNSKYKNGTITVESQSTCTYGFFDMHEPSFMLRCKIKPSDCTDHFGLLLKSDKDASICAILQFDIAMKRVSLLSLPMAVDPFWQQSCQAIPKPTDPGPDGIRVAEKIFDFNNDQEIGVKVIVDNDMIEIFVDEKIAFTYRIFRKCEFEAGIIVQDGNARFFDISITK